VKKKIISLILCTALLLNMFSVFSITSFASGEINNLTFSTLTENEKEILKGGGRISSHISSKLPVSKKSNKAVSLPEEFAVRHVKAAGDQGDFGTCWAFAALTSSETGLAQKGIIKNLSESHLSYFTYSSVNQKKAFRFIFSDYDPFNNGGFDFTACGALSNWYGPAPETDFPYSNAKIAEKYRETSVAHLQNMISFPEYEYDNEAEQAEARRFLVQQVKEQMYKTEQAVDISYLASNRSQNFNEKTNAWYNYIGAYTNHSVSIVGWDDNFPKENFNNSKYIENDGAWLVQNSWGEVWGEKGFFWLSYEDVTTDYIGIYLYESKDNYENIYSHDESVQYTPIGFDDSTEIFMSNVFTAEKDEVLEAVSFYTTDVNTQYTVRIFTSLENKKDPTSGTLQAEFSGTKSLPGYYTENLEEGVNLRKGEEFSVVVYLKNPTETLTAQVEAIYMEYRIQSTANVSGAGESFVSSDGEKWEDIHQKVIKGFDGPTEYMRLGNFAIKAFTSADKHVKFSLDSGKISLAEKLELSCLSADEIYYTLDGSDPRENGKLYTKPVSLSDGTVIRASAKDENGFGEVYEREYAQAVTALNSLTFSSASEEINVDVSSKLPETILIENGSKTVGVTATSDFEIAVNGVSVESGETIQVDVEEYVANTIEITVSEEGYKPYVYLPKIFVNPIGYDYENETMIFDESRVSVKTKYYQTLSSGQNVTEWIDSSSTMTFIVDIGQESFLVPLPERKNIIEPQINFVDECSVEMFGQRVYYKFSPDEEFTEENSVEFDYIPVVPGTTMYLCRKAGDGKFASPVIEWVIPERPVAHEEITTEKIGKTKVVLTEAEGFTYYCEETDTYSENGVFKSLTPGESYTFVVYIDSDADSFSSEKTVFEITTDTDKWFESLKCDMETGGEITAFFARITFVMRIFFTGLFE